MNEKGFEVLKALKSKNYLRFVDFVVCMKDRNVIIDFFEEIRLFCKCNRVEFLDQEPNDIDVNYSIAIGWRWLIKSQNNLIVFHDSLLPKYRGFAPLVNALINGEVEVGVTALFASDEYDKGAIISQERLAIQYPIKIKEAINGVSKLYNKIIIEIFDMIVNNAKITGIQQDERESTYSLWRDEEDYHVDWNKTAEEILRFVDAVGYPYNGAFAIINDKKVIISDVQLINDLFIENRQVGKVIFYKDNYPVVVCGNGLLMIKNMLTENRKVFSLSKFRSRFR